MCVYFCSCMTLYLKLLAPDHAAHSKVFHKEMVLPMRYYDNGVPGVLHGTVVVKRSCNNYTDKVEK